MGLFSKQAEPETIEVGYQDVVEYLREMSQPDYTKILKVVNIYRDADKGVKRVLGIKENSVTDPETAEILANDFLADDDAELGAFLETDNHETAASKKQRAVATKATKKAKK